MCLNTITGIITAKKDFYTLKVAEFVTLKSCLSYYQCITQEYKVVYKVDMRLDQLPNRLIHEGLHSIYDVYKLNKDYSIGAHPFTDSQGIILCRIKKGANYYLGDNGDIVSNQLELLEPIIMNDILLEEKVEDIHNMLSALIYALNICKSYHLNMEPC